MKVYEFPEDKLINELIKRPVFDSQEIEDKVLPILEKIKSHGDEALREFALKFDNILINEFEIDLEEAKKIGNSIDDDLKNAINQAYKNIQLFHSFQKQEIVKIETMPGVQCWRKSVGIDKVGIYIPGGTAPLFSTVLMLGIPAKIAGCHEIVLCSPSNHPAIYYAATLVGVTKIFRIGGAQAIAAMAFGTETIPKVNKIFGPGNQYVTAAKQMVSKFGTAIDMPAGPSEVAILADDTAVPEFIAADLLSQAEHGIDSQVILISTSKDIISKTLLEIDIQIEKLPRKELALAALQNSKAILVDNIDLGVEILNKYAAEHLIISTKNAEEVSEKIINAGSIFLGNYTPESAGDYASGTNHTLPTNGFATAYSGVSVDSFVKKITIQKISEKGIQNLGPIVEIMAHAESLDAHKMAITYRLKSL